MKTGDLVNTKKGLYLIIDILDSMHINGIDWKTHKNVELISTEHILEVIEFPKNVKPFFIKRCEAIVDKYYKERQNE